MAQYTVWVKNEGADSERVNLLETDDQAKAGELVNKLLSSSGSTTYDIGVSGVKGDPQTPLPANGQQQQQQRPATPAAPAPTQNVRAK